jgi:hypothetical protein
MKRRAFFCGVMAAVVGLWPWKAKSDRKRESVTYHLTREEYAWCEDGPDKLLFRSRIVTGKMNRNRNCLSGSVPRNVRVEIASLPAAYICEHAVKITVARIIDGDAVES